MLSLLALLAAVAWRPGDQEALCFVGFPPPRPRHEQNTLRERQLRVHPANTCILDTEVYYAMFRAEEKEQLL